jgi:hypothetical protein
MVQIKSSIVGKVCTYSFSNSMDMMRLMLIGLAHNRSDAYTV